jgi:hypothetical protein
MEILVIISSRIRFRKGTILPSSLHCSARKAK